MRTGLTISGIGHAAALLWAVVTFGIAPHDAPPPEFMPIDIISDADLSKMMAGSKSAPKAAAPKPLVEKVAEAKPVDNEAAKVSDKPEIITASASASEPVAEPKPPEPKPAPAPKAKPEPPKETEKKPEPKTDPVAEALKKEEAKKPEPKKEQAKIPVPKKPPPQPALDFKQIEQKLALLDKREARRTAYAGETLNSAPTLGSNTGKAAELSQNYKDAVLNCLAGHWNFPAGVTDGKDLKVRVLFELKSDGSLTTQPRVINRSANPLFQVAAENAMRAVYACAPFKFLPLANYEAWREWDVNFDPEIMFRS
jgi:outer membrane biosynthesis protein TonB